MEEDIEPNTDFAAGMALQAILSRPEIKLGRVHANVQTALEYAGELNRRIHGASDLSFLRELGICSIAYKVWATAYRLSVGAPEWDPKPHHDDEAVLTWEPNHPVAPDWKAADDDTKEMWLASLAVAAGGMTAEELSVESGLQPQQAGILLLVRGAYL